MSWTQKLGRFKTAYDSPEIYNGAALHYANAAADGYRMTASNVSVDLPSQKLTGAGRVEGAVPAGTFSADSISADLDARTVTLAGNARLRMVPGRMRMP